MAAEKQKTLLAKLEKAALLHDIGKIILRASRERRTHSVAGTGFLQKYLDDDEIIRAVGHHHSADLKGSAFASDDISYLVYEADNLAAGTDRRSNDSGKAGFSASASLESIFNLFGNTKTAEAYRLRPLLKDGRLEYPHPRESMQATEADYQKLVQELEQNFCRKPPAEMAVNELLQILEAVMAYVPSSTAQGEAADISLYDHSKMTAAFAACLKLYLDAHGLTDYREYCFAGAAEMRKQPMYLLVSGDLSGIQDFIYNIPSRGALKSLRGRSFYLDLMLENIADEILEALSISRSALIYTGGGHFYLLLPNIDEAKAVLKEINDQINSWLLEHFGSRLYLALAWEPCAANDFMAGSPTGIGTVFHRLSGKLSKIKLNRYTLEQLQEMFSPDSRLNRGADGSRECAVCHTSSAELRPYYDDSESGDEVLACHSCLGLRHLGEEILKGELIALTDKPISERSMPLPAYGGGRFLTAITKAEAEKRNSGIRRIYIKNEMLTGQSVATRLWYGDYVTRNGRGTVLDFSELASLAGADDDGKGIKRLGVLRADVDNLGAAFIAGFDRKYETFSRTASLSRQLSFFFRRYINDICEGRLSDDRSSQQQFSLFGREIGRQRAVHIVYSGGDDMFLVGAWDDLLELAVDLRRAFGRFTGGKLTFSAGLGLFPAKCPVRKLANDTGDLEDTAKNLTGKDGIALFGLDGTDGQQLAFHWQEFEEKVCGEKLRLFLDNTTLNGANSKTGLTMGKTLLYRLFSLVREPERKGKINLARFAYLLARLEPKKNAESYPAYQRLRTTLYQWYRKPEDRKQLEAALLIIIYRLREKEEKQ